MTDGILRPGDPCPCCGEPIKTSDPEMLLALSWIALLKGDKANGYVCKKAQESA